MKTVGPLIGVLVIIGLLIKYWWVVLIVAIVAGAGYLIWRETKRSQPSSTPSPPARHQNRTRTTNATIRDARSPTTTNARVHATPARSTSIREAILTRRPTPNAASGNTYTAIDIETTGLDPDVDRIVEIGLVKFATDGTVLDEFSTLINHPGSSREAREIHQIDDKDLVGAPVMGQVLPEVISFVTGTVLVAHNLDFEVGFLAAAAHQARVPLPDIVAVCTLRTSRRQLEGRAFSLTAMYKTATGEWAENKHTALGDARAIREVLLWLLRHAPSPLYLTELPSKATRFPGAIDTCPISCRPVPLTKASVSELLASFPQSSTPRKGNAQEIQRYKALLDDCVDDGRLTLEEATALTRQARLTQLTGTQLRQLHEDAWNATFSEERDDDWTQLTPVRRREMYLLADGLGLNILAEKVGAVIEACAEPEPPPESRYLRGCRVAICGDTSELVQLRARAEAYGAKVAVRITKTVQWVASTTPDADDPHHVAARTHGIPILEPDRALQRLNEDIRDAELRAFERQRELDEYQARRDLRAAEADAYWRPAWRTRELDCDPEYGFY